MPARILRFKAFKKIRHIIVFLNSYLIYDSRDDTLLITIEISFTSTKRFIIDPKYLI